MSLFWDFLKHVQFYFFMGYFTTSIIVLNAVSCLPDHIFQHIFYVFIRGFNKCMNNKVITYGNVENLIYSQHSAWEMGYLDCFNTRRTTTNPYVEEVREYITDMFRDEPQTHFFRGRTQHHGFCAGVHNTQLILHYEGDMDIESVRAMTWDLTTRYANYVSINEHVIGFMEAFLNEHLDGTSTIRLA